MTFDLTNLSTGQIAVIAAIATVMAAVISAFSALTTAAITGWMIARRDRAAAVRAYKAKELDVLSKDLTSLSSLMIRIGTYRDPKALTALDDRKAIHVPVVFAREEHARELMQRLGKARTSLYALAKGTTIDDAVAAAAKQTAGIINLLSDYVEACALDGNLDTADLKKQQKNKVKEWLKASVQQDLVNSNDPV